MSYTCIAIMVVGIAVALYGMNIQKKGSPIGQPLAIIGAILAIGCALWNATSSFGGDNAAIAREQRYIMLESKFLAKDIAKQLPSVKKVAVFVDPSNYFDEWGDERTEPRKDYAVEGLKEGFGSGVEIQEVYVTPKKIQKPAPQKAPDGTEIMPMPPMSAMGGMMSAADITKCIKDAKDAEVIIVAHQLPPMMSLGQAMLLFKGKKVALINCGNASDSAKVFQDGGKNAGELLCMVVSKRSAVYDDSMPSNEQKAFDKRYIVISKDNYSATIAEAMK
jgi:hypothetical protein